MKFVIAVLALLTVGACSASVSTAVQIPGPTVVTPVEGVYPNCNFGIDANTMKCALPAVN